MIEKKIGVFGSAFNPPTKGHLDVLQQASQYFDKILLIPSVAHAFSKKMLPFNDRLAMCHLFLETVHNIPDCKFEVSSVELNILGERSDKPVYTYDLLKYLSVCSPDDSFCFIRGPDNASQAVWKRFYRATDIKKHWLIFTAIERVNIRSTYVWQLLVTKKLDDNKKKTLNKFLLPSIYQYIISNNCIKTKFYET